MPTIRHTPVPAPLAAVFKKENIRLRTFKSVGAFERALQKFLKRNHVLHLSTCSGNQPRSTPLEFRSCGMTFYILSEGGGKFENLRKNHRVSFSIAEPYNSEEDYWSYKGVQAFGTARVYSRKENPKEFHEALKKMKIGKVLKRLGMKELPAAFNYRIIEITPDRLKYGNPREGIYWVHWQK
ncbi:MAG: pyridoxamine 5'-phosphate oxidase family protein [Desulfobacterota bacterium]|nr:pyridoxamine 5'-phosphate oxidase family protein [Thermodesulfobacteriota bacterium]